MPDQEREPGSRVGSIKTVVEVVAIVTAGCWAFFRYLGHEREATKLALEQQRLATLQASAVSGTQIAAEKARLEQLRLSNGQATLALEFQAKTQAMAVEQQRLATQQSRLSLSIAESQRQLRDLELRQNVALQEQELALKRLQSEKAAHEVRYQGKYRFERSFKLEGKKRRDIDAMNAEYEVTYGFQFINRSEIPFEVSLFVIDYYIGTPAMAASDDPAISIVGSPTDRWNPLGAQKGALEWKRIGHTGSVLAAARDSIQKPWDRVADVEHLRRGGGGTANLRPTESLYYDDTYFVRAPKHAYVGFVISYCLNRCLSNDDLYSSVEWLDLDKLES